MELQIFQVDAFASHPFEGNPAAVIPLEKWLPDRILQQIAMENNLSETAFFVPVDDGYDLRWFTPVMEVNLCGHATLAAAHVLFEYFIHSQNSVRFESRSGILYVYKRDGLLILDFPSFNPEPAAIPELIEMALGSKPRLCFSGGEDLMAVFEDEDTIKRLNPDFRLLEKLPYRGIVVTAGSWEYDFVSRFFAPAVGVDEDPVTGSAHTLLIPYWSKIKGKDALIAKQVSKRGGILYCSISSERVKIGGFAVTYMRGAIYTGETE